MKFAAYMSWIQFCKNCKFNEKIWYNCGDTDFS